MSDGPDAGGLDGSGDGDFGVGFDTDFGGIDGIDGAGGLDADFVSDSLMFSFDHGASEWSDAMCDEGVNSCIEIDRPHRRNDGRELNEEQAKMLKDLERDPMRRFYGAHVLCHKFIDVEDLFRSIATEMGCVRIDLVTPNFNGTDRIVEDITDWNRWSEPYTRKKVPGGWYEGAEGTTRIVRQYWQLKKRWWDKERDRRFDRFCGMVLEVVAITWFYAEPNDYETRFQVLVKTFPAFDSGVDDYGIKKAPFKRYQPKAKALAQKVADELVKAKPQVDSVQKRKEIAERIKREREGEPRVDCGDQFGSGADVRASLDMPQETSPVYLEPRKPRYK